MDAHTVKHFQCASNDDTPLFRCDRPLADILLGPLLYPVFGKFEDNLHNPCLQTRDDYAFVQEFCDKSVRFFKKEIDRQIKIRGLLKQYLKRDITSPRIDGGSSIYCDGCISGNFLFLIYAILEVENELGSTSTLKYFQGLAYYSRFCIQRMENRSKALFFSTCPTFLIEI
jgi:hypothetical protein